MRAADADRVCLRADTGVADVNVVIAGGEVSAGVETDYWRAPHFDRYRSWLERVYAVPPPLLADFTIVLTADLSTFLGIKTRFVRSSELGVSGSKTDRLIEVLQ